MGTLLNWKNTLELIERVANERLTLEPGETRRFNAFQEDYASLFMSFSPTDTVLELEDLPVREIIADATAPSLSLGLLRTFSAHSGLYRLVALHAITLKGQLGGVYAIYHFKAV